MPANDDEHLGHYQFGRYLFTKEYEEGGPFTFTEGEYPAQTRYAMTRQPNATERENLGEDWSPAYLAGTMDVTHHPPAEQLPERTVIGNAAARAERRANPRQVGAESTGRTVHSKSFHARYSPTDEVDFMSVEKGSRVMMPTLIGLGQNAARATTGQDLRPSTNLSVHSQKIVDRLQSAGVVPHSESTSNELTFEMATPMSARGGLEGHFSTLMDRRRREADLSGGEEPIPVTEVIAARQTGRDIVRRAHPRLTKSPIRPSI